MFKCLLMTFLCLGSTLCAAEIRIPQVAVTGVANLKRPADEVTFSLGVVTQAETANDALRNNSDQMTKVIAALKKAGLDPKEFKTGQFSVQPVYSTRPKNAPDDWRPRILAYQVQNRLNVRTMQLDKVGTWIDVGVKQGANAVDDIIFGLHDPREHRAAAIREAATYAKNDALVLAANTDTRLESVLSIALDQAAIQPVYKRAEMLAYAPGASPAFGDAPPIEAGDIDVHATVTIVYEISSHF